MTPKISAHLWACNYALTTLAGALLLFEVQPIISKFILPWFGGSPAVWTTCMVFFQTLLFAGYAYAHLSAKYLGPYAQAAVHIGLLAAAVWLLPIAPDLAWKPGAESAPTWRILSLLAASVGLPYFVLSATGPLVQSWFCRSYPGRSPYRLYALSNLGSLVALLAYPFYLEPHFAVGRQASLWTGGFVLFALLCGALALGAARTRRVAASEETGSRTDDPDAAPPGWRVRLAWLGLPALASMMLLATTNHVCQDVAVMPFLWVAPLSLYLLSFIVCFDHPGWYWRKAYALAALFALLAVGFIDQLITGGSGLSFSFVQEVGLHFVALFALCMVCHGELVRLRPNPRYLTGFYLMISAGGALGGLLVSLIAPLVFSTFIEWKLGLVAGCLLSARVALEGQPRSFFHRRFALIAGSLLLVFVGLSCVPRFQAAGGAALNESARNFYGVISVVERNRDNPVQHTLNFYSGRIVHGLQFADATKRREPTAYYGRPAGVGQALAALAGRPNLRAGLVGLGIGTLAAYAEPGQSFHFYELNADVLEFAERHFSYLSDCRGTCEVTLGDARLSLESEPDQHFDLLVLDAFSGDAVPTHLLTREGFAIYERHLQPGAIIAVNISNRYLDLTPVLVGLADEFGYEWRRVLSAGDPDRGQFPADWMLLSRSADTLAAIPGRADAAETAPRTVLWTDDHSDLFGILK
jgi:hypothetical protein